MIKNLIGFVALLLLVACSESSASTAERFQGIVEHEERRLAFELPGRVERVHVQRGSVVSAGDELARLDDRLERTSRDMRVAEALAAERDVERLRAGSRDEEVRAASARVRSVKAREEQLERSLVREENLFATGAIAKARIEELAAQRDALRGERESLEEQLAVLRKGPRSVDIASAEARAEAARKGVALADERLLRYTLRAPISGKVLDVHVEEGEVANAGTPVITLADAGTMRADVFVPQSRLDGLRVGAPASIRVDALDTALRGRIEWISPNTEFTPRFLFSDRERPNLVVRVRVRIDDPEGVLHAGVPAFVSFERSAP